MTRQELLNTIKANTTTNNNGAFAIVLTHFNFYNKKHFNRIITTCNSYEQAKATSEQLKKEYANELKANECKITFATTRIFTDGYNYKFAKQS